MDWKIKAGEINARWTNARMFTTRDRIRFIALALAGEAGELANVVKKQWRDAGHWTPEQVMHNDIATREELADVVIYAYALASVLNIDLDAECARKMEVVEQRPFAKG